MGILRKIAGGIRWLFGALRKLVSMVMSLVFVARVIRFFRRQKRRRE